MTVKMEAIAELPEIKSELNTDDFGSHNNVVTTTPQPQQQQHEQQQNNCQWVSTSTFFLLLQWTAGQTSLSSCLNIRKVSCNLPSEDNPLRRLCGLIVLY